MKNALLMAMAFVMGTMAIRPVQASTVAFNWVTPANENTVLGLSYSQTSNGITLTAYGLTAPSNLTQPATAGPDLYAKNGGAGETGLGMATDPANDHEISAALHDGIQVDFAQAIAAAPKSPAAMMISSAQSGEGWEIYGSNTLLTVGQELASGWGSNSNPTVTVNLPDWGEYTYYTLLATGATPCDTDANILLGTVTINRTTTVTSTPEPGSLLMVGSALVLIGVAMKKARKKA
jgi:hypothetical protein